MGLTLCVVAGADLYTSNCMYSSIAVYEGEPWCQGLEVLPTCSAVPLRTRLHWRPPARIAGCGLARRAAAVFNQLHALGPCLLRWPGLPAVSIHVGQGGPDCWACCTAQAACPDLGDQQLTVAQLQDVTACWACCAACAARTCATSWARCCWWASWLAERCLRGVATL